MLALFIQAIDGRTLFVVPHRVLSVQQVSSVAREYSAARVGDGSPNVRAIQSPGWVGNGNGGTENMPGSGEYTVHVVFGAFDVISLTVGELVLCGVKAHGGTMFATVKALYRVKQGVLTMSKDASVVNVLRRFAEVSLLLEELVHSRPRIWSSADPNIEYTDPINVMERRRLKEPLTQDTAMHVWRTDKPESATSASDVSGAAHLEALRIEGLLREGGFGFADDMGDSIIPTHARLRRGRSHGDAAPSVAASIAPSKEQRTSEPRSVRGPPVGVTSSTLHAGSPGRTSQVSDTEQKSPHHRRDDRKQQVKNVPQKAVTLPVKPTIVADVVSVQQGSSADDAVVAIGPEQRKVADGVGVSFTAASPRPSTSSVGLASDVLDDLFGSPTPASPPSQPQGAIPRHRGESDKLASPKADDDHAPAGIDSAGTSPATLRQQGPNIRRIPTPTEHPFGLEFSEQLDVELDTEARVRQCGITGTVRLSLLPEESKFFVIGQLSDADLREVEEHEVRLEVASVAVALLFASTGGSPCMQPNGQFCVSTGFDESGEYRRFVQFRVLVASGLAADAASTAPMMFARSVDLLRYVLPADVVAQLQQAYSGELVLPVKMKVVWAGSGSGEQTQKTSKIMYAVNPKMPPLSELAIGFSLDSQSVARVDGQPPFTGSAVGPHPSAPMSGSSWWGIVQDGILKAEKPFLAARFLMSTGTPPTPDIVVHFSTNAAFPAMSAGAGDRSSVAQSVIARALGVVFRLTSLDGQELPLAVGCPPGGATVTSGRYVVVHHPPSQ